MRFVEDGVKWLMVDGQSLHRACLCIRYQVLPQSPSCYKGHQGRVSARKDDTEAYKNNFAPVHLCVFASLRETTKRNQRSTLVCGISE